MKYYKINFFLLMKENRIIKYVTDKYLSFLFILI